MEETDFELFIKCFTDTEFIPFVRENKWLLRKYSCAYDIMIRCKQPGVLSQESALSSLTLFEVIEKKGEKPTLLASDKGVKITTPLHVYHPQGGKRRPKNPVYSGLPVKEVALGVGIMKSSGHFDKKVFCLGLDLHLPEFSQTLRLTTPNFQVRTKPLKACQAEGEENFIYLSPSNVQQRGRKRKVQDADLEGEPRFTTKTIQTGDNNFMFSLTNQELGSQQSRTKASSPSAQQPDLVLAPELEIPNFSSYENIFGPPLTAEGAPVLSETLVLDDLQAQAQMGQFYQEHVDQLFNQKLMSVFHQLSLLQSCKLI